MSDAPSVFSAWALPPGSPPVEASAASFEAGGVRVEVANLEAETLEAIARALRDSAPRLRARRNAELVAALGRTGRRFLDPGDELRLRALDLVGSTAGLSAAMSAWVLDGMAADWTEERLGALLHRELPDPAALEGFVESDGRKVRALGPDLCLQIVAGSVPGVGVTALLRSLIVRAPTLLKPGRGDVALPVLFARALAEEDPALAESLAVAYWPGGRGGVEEWALSMADAVVVYGSNDTIERTRARVPVTARFVAYHHRVGVGVVGRGALSGTELGPTAEAVARAVALFDQRGCVSPQLLYVERGGDASPAEFAGRLASALEALEASLPSGRPEDAVAARIQQLRGTAELTAASGAGVEVYHGAEAPWTVIFDPRPGSPPGCGGRVVRVEPVDDVMHTADRLAALRPHLQSVGVAGVGGRLEALAETLSAVGVSRMAPFDRIGFPPPWWHHDGEGPLRALLRWADLEG